MPLKDPEKRREYQRKYIEKHKALGLCIFCVAKAVHGYTYCLKHIYLARIRANKYYQAYHRERAEYNRNRDKKMRATHRCGKCGTPLLEEEKTFYCMNCSSRTYGISMSEVRRNYAYCKKTVT